MRVIEGPPQATSDLPDAEALIREARHRQHRRWFFIAIIVVIAMVVSGVRYAIVSRLSARARTTSAPSPTTTLSPTQLGSFVSPKTPSALAVTADSDLVVADTGRDQILRHLATGKFQVVAGEGKLGFSGDGGPAVCSELWIGKSQGIAIASTGYRTTRSDGS